MTSETLQELIGLVEYKVDTFSSDYDDFVDEFGIELDAHGLLVWLRNGRPRCGANL